MARRGSGFRTAVKVIKAIDRAQKQAAREAERRRKQQEREEVRRQREHEKMLRQQEREEVRRQREYEKMLRDQERERVAREKAKAAAEKAGFKQNLENAKLAFEKRCNERVQLRNKYVDQELR